MKKVRVTELHSQDAFSLFGFSPAKIGHVFEVLKEKPSELGEGFVRLEGNDLDRGGDWTCFAGCKYEVLVDDQQSS